jgi:hypothetical protein
LITYRLESPAFRNQKAKLAPPNFDEDLIRAICERAKGNPRGILRLANRVFRRAVSKEARIATIDLLNA